MTDARKTKIRKVGLHLFRVIVVALILFLIHRQHQEYRAAAAVEGLAGITLGQAQEFFSDATAISDLAGDGSQIVTGKDGREFGYVLQTSPQSDEIIGYSGPNNTLIAFGAEDRIVGARLLRSEDTRDHAELVMEDGEFLRSFVGMTAEEASQLEEVDGVSGATLTSLAVAEGVIHRLGGASRPGRFPAEVPMEKVTALFPEAKRFAASETLAGLHEALDSNGAVIGYVARTTPTADKVMGYQGPTDALIALEPDGRTISGLAVNKSYDNEPYVGYVAEEAYHLNYFNGWTLECLAATNLVDAGVEGVSGATMTSVAMAEGVQARARKLIEPPPPGADAAGRSWSPRGRDIGTVIVVALGLALGLTKARGSRRMRVAFQLGLIGYLGFVNGDMVSQALLAGWAQNGVAWRFAPGLALLTGAALLVPIVSKKNVYCAQLCPFGAAQALVKHRARWRLKLPRRVRQFLELIPAMLLLWVLVVAMMRLPVNLAGVEPFDAFLWKVAGSSAITIALVGLVASAFLPMAYCRYGCPTGALLNFLRFNGRSDRFSIKDGFALALMGVAAFL